MESPTPLAAYLRDTGQRQSDFCRSSGYSDAIVSMWFTGKRRPNGDNRLRISELTRGRIPVTAWKTDKRHDGKSTLQAKKQVALRHAAGGK